MFKCDFNIKSMNIKKLWMLEIDGDGQSCKKFKRWLLTWESQTLTNFIFKCDLYFEKINVNSCSEGQN